MEPRLNGLRLHQGFLGDGFYRGLKKFDVPTLILHGDDDQIVPIGAAALLSAKIVKNATPEGVSRASARNAHNPRRPDQR